MKYFFTLIVACLPFVGFADQNIPNLKGEWLGINKTISESKGLKPGKRK